MSKFAFFVRSLCYFLLISSISILVETGVSLRTTLCVALGTMFIFHKFHQSIFKQRKSIIIVIHFIPSLFLYYTTSIIPDFIIKSLSSSQGSFVITETKDITRLLSFIVLYFSLSTSGYLKTRLWARVEFVILTIAYFSIFAAHRNYNFTSPKVISDFSWSLGIPYQITFIVIGIIFSIALVLHLSSIEFKEFTKANSEFPSKRKLWRLSLIPIILLLVISYAFLGYRYNQLTSAADGRQSNGVGENNTEGESPLNFNSGVSGTKEPVGLVRLNNSIFDNPDTTVIYFREGALSKFAKSEMVNAKGHYDKETPAVAPGENFKLELNSFPKQRRKEVSQSVFLLHDHKNIFALDYLIQANRIKNPKPKRFSTAYRVNSLAQGFALSELKNENVGNTNWSDNEWVHYLEAPGKYQISEAEKIFFSNTPYDLSKPILSSKGEDLRYALLAFEITKDIYNPVEKAIAIIDYLGEESLYSLNPKHPPSLDPVASYLFSKEMKGYCVHFAHAAVYMMRIVGVPARIAVGYAPDTKYAKDGHILLQRGDRHAWPEIYVSGYGWVAADIAPQNYEGEGELVPDESTLEDLMKEVDPSDELIPETIEEDNDLLDEKEALIKFVNFAAKALKWLIILISILYILTKVYFRSILFLTPKGQNRSDVLKYYRSLLVFLFDCGMPRNIGETRWQYAKRVKNQIGLDLSSITEVVNGEKEHEIDYKDLTKKAKSSIVSNSSIITRLFAVLNPISITRYNKW